MRYQVTLPYSEVCMHMRIAGKEAEVELRQGGMAQVYMNDDLVSFPITRGEAGIFRSDIVDQILLHYRTNYGPMSRDEGYALLDRAEGRSDYFTLAEILTLEAAGIKAIEWKAAEAARRARAFAMRAG